MRQFALLLCVICLAFSVHGAEQEIEIEGTVKEPGGQPVHRAIISVEEAKLLVETDEEGGFRLKLPPGTYTVIVEAPGFEVRGERFSTGKQHQVRMDFVLLPHRLEFEEIVLASDELTTGISVSSPSASINPGNKTTATSVLATVTDVPGVAPLGQGGLFQVPSIRGAARERTILLLESVRVTSERRTGASFSFVDPLLTERLQIIRGPAPVLYGSNGETGLIQGQLLEPTATSPETEFRTGYQSNSNENWQALSFKNGTERFQYALGAVRRDGGDYAAGNDLEYPSGFTRINLLAKARWLTGNGILTFAIMPSWTDDIEKASSDSFTRPTLYPEERHQVYQVDWQNAFLQSTYDFQVQGWYHPNSLITQDDRVTDGVVTSRAIVFNDTDDYGARFRIGREISGNWRFWTGVDLFGRTNVDAREEDYALSETGSGLEPIDAFTSIQDGSYTDTGLFLTANGTIGSMQGSAGLRVQRVHISNNAGTRVSDAEYSWSGNFGGSVPLNSNWDAVFNLGRGIRPATISEKFFTGATGRGSVTGNPNLVTESNFELDGGIRYRRNNAYGAFYLFRNHIDNFIARVRIEEDAFTFANLSEVVIYGIEGEGFYSWNDLRFYGNFHVIQGHDSGEADINDIPPSRLVGGIEYQPAGQRWGASFETVRQFRKNDPGPDELARDAALILNAKAELSLFPQVKFRIGALNLTNQAYYDSADDRAPLAIGRSATVELLLNFQ